MEEGKYQDNLPAGVGDSNDDGDLLITSSWPIYDEKKDILRVCFKN